MWNEGGREHLECTQTQLPNRPKTTRLPGARARTRR
jgi:hypothetical protein